MAPHTQIFGHVGMPCKGKHHEYLHPHSPGAESLFSDVFDFGWNAMWADLDALLTGMPPLPRAAKKGRINRKQF